MSIAADYRIEACDYCGATGTLKATARQGNELRLFCHSSERSCYNEARGRYFEPCTCDIEFDKVLYEAVDRWHITRPDPICRLHGVD